ncbi:uncharacterized protein LOC114282022 [Camellia sinensis]|uniref:uncharacterized protein LOC114282022 n=1 Tax=Camellia sinensis TaxID=4442 RepID=UPI001036BB84|nr:uncharacterized protein LOC114282022 [Camellia sinensis]
MALTPYFEPVRASLLHCTPLPTLEQVISELLLEETRLGTLHPHPVDSVLATPQTQSSPSPQQSTAYIYCQNCGLPSTHLLVHCPVRLCRFCNKTGPGHLQQDCFHIPDRTSPGSSYPSLCCFSSYPSLSQSKKQTLTVHSSKEAEYRALTDTTQELVWLRWLLADIDVTPSGATAFFCDN